MDTIINKLLFTAKSILKPRNPTRKMQVAVYSDQYRLIYYSVPKVACTTIKTCIAKLDNIETKYLGVNQKNTAIKRLTIKEASATQYNDYYHFSLVRNPWDRLFSCYKNKIYDPPRFFPKSNPYYNEKGEFKDFISRYGDLGFKDMQFEDFVDFVAKIPDNMCDPHFLPQHYFFELERLDFLGRFENFQPDMLTVLKKTAPDFDAFEIISEKRTSSSPSYYKDAYDDRTRELVAKKYHQDIKLFGYTF